MTGAVIRAGDGGDVEPSADDLPRDEARRRRRVASIVSKVLLVTAGVLIVAAVLTSRDDAARVTAGVVQLATPTPVSLAPAVAAAPVVASEVALPQHLRIDKIGVSAAITPVGLGADGTLVVPEPTTTGWYDLGVRPGEPGYAVIAGHVDTYEGPDVFFRLRELAPGDAIAVRTADGAEVTFLVESVEQQAKSALPTSRMWTADGRPMLALITCGGAFDGKARTYLDNVVVYATLTPAPS